MWLKRVDKHGRLVVWESGDLILCHYLAGPASRHLLVKENTQGTLRKPALLRLEGKRHTLVLCATYMHFIRVWVFFLAMEHRPCC